MPIAALSKTLLRLQSRATMDSPEWRAAVARAKRLGIEAYQAGRVRWDASAATTVLVERVTSNEPWGPTSKDCAQVADLSYDAVEAPRVMEVSATRDAPT